MQLAAIRPTPLSVLHKAALLPVSSSASGAEPTCGPRRACRFTRSVVGEAGLGNFIYAHGRSGKRYVFSVIRRDQTALYESAVFATGDPSDGQMNLALNANHIGSEFRTVFVHLVESQTEAARVYGDLQGAGWRG